MNAHEAYEWLQEHNCDIGEYDGNDFVIVEPQSDNPVDNPLFLEALAAIGISEDDSDNHWGYGDEYTQCHNCSQIIRTSPTHACWKPDFWLNLRDGEILCNECTKENANVYFVWYAKEAVEGVAHICLLDPEDHGFTKIIEDLEYGYHPGQNDDPRKLIAWANENNFEIAFDVRQNPFTATFDVWLRGQPVGEDKIIYTPIDVEQIRKILLVSDSKYSHLRAQFREWPTPEEQMKATLKRTSKGG